MSSVGGKLAEEPPKYLWLSPVYRSGFEFGVDASPDLFGNVYVQDSYIEGICGEGRRLRRQIHALYAITFILACLVGTGGLPTDVEAEAFGIKVPIGVLSQQVLSAIMAATYSYMITSFLNAVILSIGIGKIMEMYGPSAWEYALARYDAGLLFGTLFRVKNVGYSSPWYEYLFIFIIFLVSFATMTLHFAVIFIASVLSFNAARDAGDVLSPILGWFSMVTVALAFLYALIAIAVPFKYTLRTPSLS